MKDGGSKRRQIVGGMLERAGLTIEAFYFALGEHPQLWNEDIGE
jgi:hypothetical protein